LRVAGGYEKYFTQTHTTGEAMSENQDTQIRRFNLVHQTRLETIEGITIDLRHPDLTPDIWWTTDLSRDWMPAYFRFPWTDVARAESRRLFRKVLDNDPPDPQTISAGDTVMVSKVVSVKVGDHFDVQEDQEVRDAYLSIIRADGNQIEWPIPIRFAQKSSLVAPDGSLRNMLDTVAKRISDRLRSDGIPDLGAFGSEDDELTPAQQCFVMCDNLTLRISPLETTFSQLQEAEDIKSRFRRVIDDAVTLGYFWAKVEADNSMRPLADKALKSRAGGSKGGIASGNTRRQNATTKWRAVALELAVDSRRQDPGISKENLITEIILNWTVDYRPQSRRTFGTFIAEQEKLGEIPLRVGGREKER